MSILEKFYNFILVFEPMLRKEYSKVSKAEKKKLSFVHFAIAYYAELSKKERKRIQNLIETL